MPKIKVPTAPPKKPANAAKTPHSSPAGMPEKALEHVKQKKNGLKMNERLRDLLKEMDTEVYQ